VDEQPLQFADVLPGEVAAEPAEASGEGSSYEYETESEDFVVEEGLQSSAAGNLGNLDQSVQGLRSTPQASASVGQGQSLSRRTASHPDASLIVQSKLAHTLAAAFQERQRAIGQSVGFDVEANRQSQHAAIAAKQPQAQNIILLE